MAGFDVTNGLAKSLSTTTTMASTTTVAASVAPAVAAAVATSEHAAATMNQSATQSTGMSVPTSDTSATSSQGWTDYDNWLKYVQDSLGLSGVNAKVVQAWEDFGEGDNADFKGYYYFITTLTENLVGTAVSFTPNAGGDPALLLAVFLDPDGIAVWNRSQGGTILVQQAPSGEGKYSTDAKAFLGEYGPSRFKSDSAAGGGMARASSFTGAPFAGAASSSSSAVGNDYGFNASAGASNDSVQAMQAAELTATSTVTGRYGAGTAIGTALGAGAAGAAGSSTPGGGAFGFGGPSTASGQPEFGTPASGIELTTSIPTVESADVDDRGTPTFTSAYTATAAPPTPPEDPAPAASPPFPPVDVDVADISRQEGLNVADVISKSDNVRFDFNSTQVFRQALVDDQDEDGIITDSVSPLEANGIATNRPKILLCSDYDLGFEDPGGMEIDESYSHFHDALDYSKSLRRNVASFYDTVLFEEIELLTDLEKAHEEKKSKLQRAIEYIRSIDEFKVRFISKIRDYNGADLQYIGYLPHLNPTRAVRQVFYNLGQAPVHGGNYLVNRLYEVYETSTGIASPALGEDLWFALKKFPNSVTETHSLFQSKPQGLASYNFVHYCNMHTGQLTDPTAENAVATSSGLKMVPAGPSGDSRKASYWSYKIGMGSAALEVAMHNDLPDNLVGTHLKLGDEASFWLDSYKSTRDMYLGRSTAAISAHLAQSLYVEMMRAYLIRTNEYTLAENDGHQYNINFQSYCDLIGDLIGNAGDQQTEFKDIDNTKKLGKLLKYPGLENTIYPFEKPNTKFEAGDKKTAVSGITKWFDENIGNIFEERPTDFRGLDNFAEEFAALVNSVEDRVSSFCIDGHGQLFFNEIARAFTGLFTGEINENTQHPQKSIKYHRLTGGFDFSEYVAEEIDYGDFEPPIDPEEFEEIIEDMEDRQQETELITGSKEAAEIQYQADQLNIYEGAKDAAEAQAQADTMTGRYMDPSYLADNGVLYEAGIPMDEEEFGTEGILGGMMDLKDEMMPVTDGDMMGEEFFNMMDTAGVDASAVTNAVGEIMTEMEVLTDMETSAIDQASTAGVDESLFQGLLSETSNLDSVPMEDMAGEMATEPAAAGLAIAQTESVTESNPNWGAAVDQQMQETADQEPLVLEMQATSYTANHAAQMLIKTIQADNTSDPAGGDDVGTMNDTLDIRDAFAHINDVFESENLTIAENKIYFIRKAAFIIDLFEKLPTLSSRQFWYLVYNSTQGEVTSPYYQTTGASFNVTLLEKLLGLESTQAQGYENQCAIAHILQIISAFCQAVEKAMMYNVAALADEKNLSPRTISAEDNAFVLNLADVFFGENGSIIYGREVDANANCTAVGPSIGKTTSGVVARGGLTHLELRAGVMMMISGVAKGLKQKIGVKSNTKLCRYTLKPMEGTYSATSSGDPLRRFYTTLRVDEITITAAMAQLMLPAVDNVDPKKGPVRWKLTRGIFQDTGYGLNMEEKVNRYVIPEVIHEIVDKGAVGMTSQNDGDNAVAEMIWRIFHQANGGTAMGPDGTNFDLGSAPGQGGTRTAEQTLTRLIRHHYSYLLDKDAIVPYTFVEENEIPNKPYEISPLRGGLSMIIRSCVYNREQTRRELEYLRMLSQHYLDAKNSMLGLTEDPNGAELFEFSKLPAVEAQEIIKYSSLRQTFLRSFIASEEAGIKNYAYLPSSNFVHPNVLTERFPNMLNAMLKSNAMLQQQDTNDYKFFNIGPGSETAAVPQSVFDQRTTNAKALLEEGRIFAVGFPEGLIDTNMSNEPVNVLERLLLLQENTMHYFTENAGEVQPTFRLFWPGLFINRANVFSALHNSSVATNGWKGFIEGLEYGVIDPDTGRYKIISHSLLVEKLKVIIRKKENNLMSGRLAANSDTQRANVIIFNHVLDAMLQIYIDLYAGLNTAETSFSVNLESNVLYIDDMTLENIDLLIQHPSIGIESAEVILDEKTIVSFREFFSRQTADSDLDVAYHRYANFIAHTQARLFSSDQMVTMTLVPNIFDRVFLIYSHLGQMRRSEISEGQEIFGPFRFDDHDDALIYNIMKNDYNALVYFRSLSI